jgi:hypothetical protein
VKPYPIAGKFPVHFMNIIYVMSTDYKVLSSNLEEIFEESRQHLLEFYFAMVIVHDFESFVFDDFHKRVIWLIKNRFYKDISEHFDNQWYLKQQLEEIIFSDDICCSHILCISKDGGRNNKTLMFYLEDRTYSIILNNKTNFVNFWRYRTYLLYDNNYIHTHDMFDLIFRHSDRYVNEVFEAQCDDNLAVARSVKIPHAIGRGQQAALDSKERKRQKDKELVRKRLRKRNQYDFIDAEPQGLMDLGMTPETADMLDTGIATMQDLVSTLEKFSCDKSFGNLDSKLDKLNTILENFSPEKLCKISDKTADSVYKQLKRTIRDIKGDLTSKLKTLSHIVIICGAILYYVTNRNEVSMTQLGLAIATAFISTDLFTDRKFFGCLLGFFSKIKFGKVEPQMLNEDDFKFGMQTITAIMTTFFSVNFSKNVPASLFMGLSNFDRITNSLTSCTTFLIEVVEKVVNWIRISFLDSPSLRFLYTNRTDVNNYMDEVRLIFDDYQRQVLYPNDENMAKVSSYIQVGRQLLRSLGRDNKDRGSYMLLSKDVTNLEKIKAFFLASNYKIQGNRAEAVGICLAGGPGTGKSITAVFLAYAIASVVLDEKRFQEFLYNDSSFLYNRQFENKYYDCYTAEHIITFFDDLGQCVDVAGNPDNEWMNLIRAINGFTYNLHSADIDEKGKVVFNSKFVVVTTNNKKFQPQSIHEKEAIDRRFPIRVVVYPKEEYCLNPDSDEWTQRFDTSKLPTINFDSKFDKSSITTFNPDIQRFRCVDGDGTPYGNSFEFPELVKMCINEYSKRYKWREYQKQAYIDTAHKYRALYRPEAQSNHTGHMTDMIEEVLNRSENSNTDILFSELDLSGITENERRLIESVMLDIDWSQIRARNAIRACFHSLFSHIDPLQYNFTIVLINVILKFDIEFDSKDPDTYLRTLVALSFQHDSDYGVNDIMFISKVIKRSEMTWDQHFSYIWTTLEENDPTGLLLFIHGCYEVSPFVTTYVTILGSAVVIKGFSWISKWVASLFGIVDTPKTENQSYGASDHAKTMRRPTNYKAIVDKLKSPPQGIQPQMSTHIDESGSQLIKSMVTTNQYAMSLEDADRGFHCIAAQLFFVVDTVCILPMHYLLWWYELIDEDDSNRHIRVKISKRNKKKHGDDFEFFVTIQDFIDGIQLGALQQNELVLIQLPRNKVPCHKDRIDNFVEAADGSMNSSNISVLLPLVGKDLDIEYIHAVAVGIDDGLGLEVGWNNETYNVRKYYKYTAGTGKGDCGAPLCVLNSRLGIRKIMGIHNAGNPDLKMGYAGAVTQADLRSDLALFTGIIYNKPDPNIIPQFNKNFTGTQNVIGKMNKFPSRPLKSDIVKSRLHGTYKKSNYAPARLRAKYDKVNKCVVPGTDPMLISLSCFKKEPVLVDNLLLKTATDYYKSFLFKNEKRKVDKRLLTWLEALFGIEAEEDSSRVNPKSSGGYPFNTHGYVNYKKILFSLPRYSKEWYDVWEVVEKELNDLEQQLMNNERPNFYNTCNNKDERRKLEKVLACKSRLFNGCPFYYLMIMKRYDGSFQIMFTKNRIYNGSTLGINPFSTEWDIATKYLAEVNPKLDNIIDGDYKEYDISLVSMILWAVLDVVNEWYDDEYSFIRTICWLEVVNSQNLVDGTVFTLNYSLPSGNPMTPYINTIYGHIAMRISWMKLGCDITLFDDNVRLLQHGDDHAMSVSDEYVSIFNGCTVVQPLSEIGLTYTSSDKTLFFSEKKDIGDITYLKRKFVKWNARFIGPLELDVVLEIPMWTKYKNTWKDYAMQIDDSLRELSIHDKDTFNFWSKKILSAVREWYPDLELHNRCYLSHFQLRQIALAEEAKIVW